MLPKRKLKEVFGFKDLRICFYIIFRAIKGKLNCEAKILNVFITIANKNGRD